MRFVASHLRRLFRSPQPWRELPLVFGLPRGCFSMRCAVVFSDQLTSQALQRWAGTHLLRLPALPPLSSRLFGHWCAWRQGNCTVEVPCVVRWLRCQGSKLVCLCNRTSTPPLVLAMCVALPCTCRCRALPDGQLGVLAVLREGQPQPLHLLEEVRKAQGSMQAAAAVWR